MVCIIADLPLPNGPLSQRTLCVGLGSMIHVKISFMTFIRVPSAHLGGGSLSEESCMAASEAALRRRSRPLKHIALNHKTFVYNSGYDAPCSFELWLICV